MSLTDTAIRNARILEKAYKLTDARGLYLLINKTGKYFRWDYRFAGKRKTYSLGVYPDVKLKDAREKHEDLRRLLAQGIDPMEYKKDVKAKIHSEALHSFEAIAREWFHKNKSIWVEKHAQTILSRLESNVFPWLGATGVAEISAPLLLETLRRIEDRGAIETAHRIKQVCSQIFRYAIATGRADRDPSADLKGALPPTRAKNMATITVPSRIGELMRAIQGYEGNLITRCALRLAPLVFVRPGELRHAEWSEIDFDTAQWKIPAKKMKMGRTHIVPLSEQSLAIFREILPLTKNGKYVFPSLRSGSRPMSDNTINAALRRMGYDKNEITGHGFRAMASTLLHEHGWNSDVIERQLAHVENNKVKRAYNHAEHLDVRREMMQWWADFLGRLKEETR